MKDGLYKQAGVNDFAYIYRGSLYRWVWNVRGDDAGWYAFTSLASTFAPSSPLSFLLLTGYDYHESCACFEWT